MCPLDYAAHLYSRQPELDEMFQIMGGGQYELSHMWKLPADELEKVIKTLVALGADVMAAYEFADGVRMSIQDRIVLRGKNYTIRRVQLGRPQLARRILELCKMTHEGEF